MQGACPERVEGLTTPPACRLMDWMHLEDAAAVAKAMGGDEDAFRVLVERHCRSVYRLAYPHDGLGRRRRGRGPGHVRPGLPAARALRIAIELRHVAVPDRVQLLDRSPAQPAASRVGQGAGGARPAGAAGAEGPSTEDLVFAGQISERVQAALNGLSEQERAAFLMRHYHGCSIEEICSALDLRTNAAKHSIFRAVKKMRVALGPFVKMRTV